MSSVRITLDELRRDYAGDDELAQPLALLSGQVMRMQAVLQRLGDSARARGEKSGPPIDVQAWLARTLEHWGLMWPQVRVRLELANDVANDVARDVAEKLPLLPDDPALEAVLIVLLNNAAQASPDSVTLRARRCDQTLCLEVVDCGGGLESGKTAGKTEGWGVGLELARATLERMGGALEIDTSEAGGVNARVILPFSMLTQVA